MRPANIYINKDIINNLRNIDERNRLNDATIPSIL